MQKLPFFLVLILHLLSGCSLLEIIPQYEPVNINNWDKIAGTKFDYAYNKILHNDSTKDSCKLSILCEVDMRKIIASGPPFIPIIPNFILPFQNNREDTFHVDISFEDCDHDFNNLNSEDFNFRLNDKNFTDFQMIGKSDDGTISRYAFRLRTGFRVKSIQISVRNISEEVIFRRKLKYIYDPHFMN